MVAFVFNTENELETFFVLHIFVSLFRPNTSETRLTLKPYAKRIHRDNILEIGSRVVKMTNIIDTFRGFGGFDTCGSGKNEHLM